MIFSNVKKIRFDAQRLRHSRSIDSLTFHKLNYSQTLYAVSYHKISFFFKAFVSELFSRSVSQVLKSFFVFFEIDLGCVLIKRAFIFSEF
jgi:hypothetical protein